MSNPVLFYEYGKARGASFVFTINTANTSSGSTASNQFKVPTIPTGNYAYTIDWGDGSNDRITYYNQAATTHTYATAGQYTLRIKGTCTGWQFNSSGDRLKLISIQQWGSLMLTNVIGQFGGCSNLTLTNVSDVLNLKNVNSFSEIFRNCSSLTTINRINEWNVSGITSFVNAFNGCTNFNDNNISTWIIGNCTMAGIFTGCSNFNGNVAPWNMLNVNSIANMFDGCSKFNRDISGWNISNVNTLSATFRNASIFNQPIGLWNTANVTNMTSVFEGASAFNQNLNNWNISKVTTLQYAFKNAIVFNQDISIWNVSQVNNFSEIFNTASNYTNAGISLNTWNTSAATNMSSMFKSCKYNLPLNLWNTSNVTNMNSMFQSNILFNQDISSFSVSNVTDFSLMFNGTSNFNNGLASGVAGTMTWTLSTTSSILMVGTFQLANAFNQNIGSWNMGKVTNTNKMFSQTAKFNNGNSPDINNWDMSSVTIMGANTSFDGMFRSASAFNQNIGNWNVSKVTNFERMFMDASLFNNGGSRDINNWNTSSAILMTNMFSSSGAALPFNQPIGNWNVSNVTSFAGFMAGKTTAVFSTTNLDSIYSGWGSRPVQSGITITFGTAKYTAAGSDGRATLVGASNNWVITDGGTTMTANIACSYTMANSLVDATGICPALTGSGVIYVAGVNGVANTAAKYDNPNDRLDVANTVNLSFTNGTNDIPFSINMWVLFTGYSSVGNWLISKRGAGGAGNLEYQLLYNTATNKLSFQKFDKINEAIKQVIGSPVSPFALNTWYNITITDNGTGTFAGMKMYINGVLQTITDDSVGGVYTGMLLGNSIIRFGQAAWALDPSSAHQGNLEDISVWRRELTQAEATYLAFATGRTYPFP